MKKELKSIIVNYSLSILKMIQLARFNSVADCLMSETNLELIPISEELVGTKIEVDPVLFHFDKNISKDEAITEMKQEGYRPATLPELLALAASDPELQRTFSIVALAATFEGSNICIMAHGVQRFSERKDVRALIFWGCEFGPNWHFLAVAI